LIIIPIAFSKEHIDEIVEASKAMKIADGEKHLVGTNYFREDLDQHEKLTVLHQQKQELEQRQWLKNEAEEADKKLATEEYKAFKKQRTLQRLAELQREEEEEAAWQRSNKGESGKSLQTPFWRTTNKPAQGAGFSAPAQISNLENEGKSKGHGLKKTILTQPTYIKVHRKHLSPDTLDAYNLPWEWDDVSSLFETSCKAFKTDPSVAEFELYYYQALDTRA